MSISSGQGDEGRTRLFSGESVLKSDLRPSAYGELDEAISAIGLARSLSTQERVRIELRRIQEVCFIAGAELATSGGKEETLPERLTAAHVEALEVLGEELEREVDLPPVFIVPGAAPAGAALDLARAVLRRAERAIVRLIESDPRASWNDNLVPFVNRLSDILFLLARYEERRAGIEYDRLKEHPGSATGP